jgi:hypothetical protein
MPKEAAVLIRVRNHLARTARRGSHFMKTSGEGEPDLVGVIDGRAVVCECKRPGKTPTPLQYAVLKQWAIAGAWALWTDGVGWYVMQPDGYCVQIGDPKALWATN